LAQAEAWLQGLIRLLSGPGTLTTLTSFNVWLECCRNIGSSSSHGL